ncbi:RHS repeat-associated core domain-containing protein [Vreelandella sp. EE27]
MRHENGTTATTHYGWDGDRLVREESDNQHSTIVYEPGSFVPMLRIDDTQEGPQLSAFVTDAIGTPMQLVAAHGETQWQGQPDDWAAVKNIRGNTAQPIRFQGQWQDEESGLYYNRHRYYDPQQGRYVSQDPIGLKGGTNLYGYVANPMGAVDPLGLSGGPYGLDGGPSSQSNHISRSVEQTESATKSCSVSSNHLIGFGQGVMSVIGGNVNFLRTLSRNMGLLGREEMRRVTIEGNTIDEAARMYVSNDFVREEANSRVKDYCGEGFMAGRAFMGTLTGLGSTALYGDVSVAVEDVIKENPHVESEEVVYRALEAMFHGN